MQLFRDTETGEFWEFDDDVIVGNPHGFYEFSAPRGGRIDAPKTLVPAVRPAPPPAAEYVPVVVSRYQLREALRLSTIQDGLVVINDLAEPGDGSQDLLAAFLEALAAPTTPAYYRSAWDELDQVSIDSAMLHAIATAVGLTQANLESVFQLGATLRA